MFITKLLVVRVGCDLKKGRLLGAAGQDKSKLSSKCRKRTHMKMSYNVRCVVKGKGVGSKKTPSLVHRAALCSIVKDKVHYRQ